MSRLISPIFRNQSGQGRRTIIKAVGSTAIVAALVGVAIWASTSSSAAPAVQLVAGPKITAQTAPDSTTTSTTVSSDPNAKYIGKPHTNGGSGLPVTAVVHGVNWTMDSSNPNGTKVGAHAISWIRDENGDKIFIETVTQVDNFGADPEGSVQLTPSAVVDIPKVDDVNSYLCLGWCTDNKDISLTNVIGELKNSDNSVQKAWTVDWTTGTLTAHSTSDVFAYYEPSTPTPADPPRPALYDTVALNTDGTATQWYTQNEGITSGGGWGGSDEYINNLRDTKTQTEVLVMTKDNAVKDRVSFPLSDSSQVDIGLTADYNGQSILVAHVVNGSTNLVWQIDEANHKFIQLDPTKVSDIH